MEDQDARDGQYPGFPLQENGAIRMKSFASWYPAPNMPVHEHRRHELAFLDDSESALFFVHEALTNEGFGKRDRSSSGGKPGIILAGVKMMEMHGSKSLCEEIL